MRPGLTSTMTIVTGETGQLVAAVTEALAMMDAALAEPGEPDLQGTEVQNSLAPQKTSELLETLLQQLRERDGAALDLWAAHRDAFAQAIGSEQAVQQVEQLLNDFEFDGALTALQTGLSKPGLD